MRHRVFGYTMLYTSIDVEAESKEEALEKASDEWGGIGWDEAIEEHVVACEPSKIDDIDDANEFLGLEDIEWGDGLDLDWYDAHFRLIKHLPSAELRKENGLYRRYVDNERTQELHAAIMALEPAEGATS